LISDVGDYIMVIGSLHHENEGQKASFQIFSLGRA